LTSTMKDSGVEWIGQIPNLWSSIRIKNIIAQRDAGAWGELEQGNNNDVICIRVADFDYSHFTIQNNKDYTLRNYSDFQIKSLKLNKGDILIEKSGGGEKTPVGRTVIFDKNFKALFANFIERIRVTEEIYYKYFQYIFSSFYSQGHTKLYIKQTTGIQNLNITEMFSREVIPLPPLSEQQAIADYLDDKCAQIDNITATINEQIEVLKQYKKSVITEAVTKGLDHNVPMKDSGVEWIGKIPEHWTLKPFEFILKERSLKNNPILTDERLALSIDKGITLYSEKTTNLDRFKDDVSLYKVVYPGDFVMNSMNMIVGAVGITPYLGCVSPAYYVFYDENTEHTKARFCDYIFRSKTIRKYLFSIGKGIMAIERGDDRVNTCRLKVSRYDLNKLKIPQPPYIEQTQIVNYLDDKCAKIDAVIADKQAQLETLAAYKKSLIYEYVTGKKSVPGFEEA
jgi:type I restriction enzyme S subunit